MGMEDRIGVKNIKIQIQSFMIVLKQDVKTKPLKLAQNFVAQLVSSLIFHLHPKLSLKMVFFTKTTRLHSTPLLYTETRALTCKKYTHSTLAQSTTKSTPTQTSLALLFGETESTIKLDRIMVFILATYLLKDPKTTSTPAE